MREVRSNHGQNFCITLKLIILAVFLNENRINGSLKRWLQKFGTGVFDPEIQRNFIKILYPERKSYFFCNIDFKIIRKVCIFFFEGIS